MLEITRCGRAYHPRFLFTWPNHRIAVMGGEQLAGVLDIVKRGAATRAGREVDEMELTMMRQCCSSRSIKNPIHILQLHGCGTMALSILERRETYWYEFVIHPQSNRPRYDAIRRFRH